MKRIVTVFSFFLPFIFSSHAQYIWVGNNSYRGYSLPNNITIAASASNCFIGGLNTSGTNTFAADIVLNSSTQLESFAGGIAQFTGKISGPHGIKNDDVDESGNGKVLYSGVPKTYTGVTTINNGATLRISSDQSLDDIVLNTGGKLIVDAGVKLTVNGSWTGGGELENYGTIELRDNVNFPGTGTNVTAMNILQINRSGNVYLDNNIVITGSLILTLGNFNINPSVRLTLNGASLVNDAGVLVGSSTSDLTVCGITGGTVLINSAVTLRNISVEGTRVLSLNGSNNLSLHGLLTISPFAKFNTGGDASQIINVGAASVDISGTFITQHPGGFVSPGSAIPGTSPYVLNVGCTIEYGRLGNQSVQGSIVGYRNLTLSGNGTKLLESGTNPVGLVSIKDNATFDVRNFTFGDVSTNLQMDGGRFRVDGVGTKPEIGGTYTLNDGVIEFYNSNTANNQTIKGISPTSGTILYKNIEVTGNKVGQSSNNISLGNSGRFMIKPFGIYESNANGISGPSFNNQSVIVENNGIFKTGNPDGFSGGTTTSIRNSIENVDLQTGSTVVYARSNPPLSNGEQFITNAHTYQHLELSGTGIKTAPATATLSIQGNLTKSGTCTFAHNNGLVLLNGANQSFAGLYFYGLELSGGPKTTNGDASIDSVLTINSNAVLNISNGDSITLKSSTTRTASIDKLLHTTLSAAITYNGTGKFVVERSLYTGRKWRLLSAPAHGQTIRESWQERGTNASGNVSGYGLKAFDTRPDWEARGFDLRANNTSIKKYSPTTNTWDAVESTNSSINAERGYLVFVTGDFTVNWPNSNATKLRTSGKLFRGDSTINIAPDKFALIGNPYASRIDLRKLTFTDPNVARVIYVFDPSATGTVGLGSWVTLEKNDLTGEYENFLPTPLYGEVSNFIESGLAFFVKGGVGQSSITFQENDKSAGSNMSSFTAGASQSIKAILNLVPATGSPIVLDGVKADFGENYSNNIDGFDIKKMGTINESVSWKTKDSMLVVDKRAMIVNNDTLHLHNNNYRIQNYQWQITSNNLDFPGRTGFLVDRYTGTVTPLDMAGTTTINFSVQNIVGSYAADRFKIVFNQVVAGPLPVNITSVAATRNKDRSVAVQWKVEQEINIVGYEVERSNNGSNFTTVHNRASNNSIGVTYDYTDLTTFIGDNFYRIKAISVGGQVQYSNIVKLNGSKATPIIKVYSNPVENEQLKLRFEVQEKGRYQVQLMNMKGHVLVNKTVNVLKVVQAETIEVLASLSAGIYQLLVIAPNGISTIQKVLIQ